MKKGDRALIKKMNQQLVLRLIQSKGPIARRDIARTSGLSAASITGIAGELIDLGLVREAGEIQSEERAGRRAIKLRLNPKAGYVVGVSLAKHIYTCVLTDLDATILHSEIHDLPLHKETDAPYQPESIVASIVNTIEHMLSQTNINSKKLMGIGIGINGIVNYQTGVSTMAPHYGWRNIALAQPIASHFNIPVHLENDARTLTIAEQLFGEGQDVDNFVAIALGYGIGAGVVANGQIYRGGHGGAGEFGHIVLQQDGPLCACGKRGCLEALASVPAIMRQIEEAIASGESSSLAGIRPLTLEAISSAAKQEDALAIRIISEAGRWLGIGMSMLVNILNPELFILTGEAVSLGTHYLKPMEAVMREYAFDGLTNSVRVVTVPGGSEVWAKGVASFVINSLFTSDENNGLL